LSTNIIDEDEYPAYQKLKWWEKIWPFISGFFLHFLWSSLGWLITGAALSYGADNWFNLLTRFINIRTAVKPKEENK
jgi:hypothetical protein